MAAATVRRFPPPRSALGAQRIAEKRSVLRVATWARVLQRVDTVRLTNCNRFAILDSLYIDREVLEALAAWAKQRGLRVQDAVQLAIISFTEDHLEVNGAYNVSSPRQAEPAPGPPD